MDLIQTKTQPLPKQLKDELKNRKKFSREKKKRKIILRAHLHIDGHLATRDSADYPLNRTQDTGGLKLIPLSVKRQKNNETSKQPRCINGERNCFMKVNHVT